MWDTPPPNSWAKIFGEKGAYLMLSWGKKTQILFAGPSPDAEGGVAYSATCHPQLKLMYKSEGQKGGLLLYLGPENPKFSSQTDQIVE